MSAATSPDLVGALPPPVRRDPMVLTWMAGVAISWFGDSAWVVALSWTAAHTLSPVLAGVVLGGEMLPQAVLVLVGGVLADRYDPRRMLVAGQVGQAAVLGAGAVAWHSGTHGAPVLLAIAVAFGIASGLTLPSGATLLRQLVSRADLGTVQGWNQISNRAMRLLGAPVGGVLVAWRGPVGVMLVDAVTFLAIAGVLTAVVRPRYRLPRASRERWRESFGDGMHYLREHETAKLFVIGLTALNVFVTPVAGLGVALRVSGSGWGAHWLGIADASLAAGAILGSVVAIRWQPAYGAAAGFRVLVVQGLAIAAVGIGWRPALVVAMVVLGFTAGAASVWLSAAFMRAIDASHLGRVSSVTSLGDMTLMPLSVPALGAVVRATSVLTATMAFGLAMSLLCAWFATRGAIRSLEA
ncbi:MAG TPA: MFS transporter [Nocardioides sp.]|uniref:MFS transporter n=1 Tax=Nocardioides sp. TaxID=35761 RepID=UPI002E3100EB|nr:MFS transporter [Nocardioides sp.]HEX3931664.1 MFS transporter [Nocardioides sp.]